MKHNTTSLVFRNSVLLLCLLFSSFRMYAGVVWVTSNADSGTGTLRQAIIDANTASGGDSVIFNLSGPVFEIGLLSPLPVITESLSIDGSSQPGATLPLNPVVLKGVGVVSFGIQFSSGGVHLRNLKFENFMNQPWYSNSSAVLCDPGFFFQGMISDVSLSNNIFVDNHQAIRFSHFDSLQNISFTDNLFEGNFISVNIYEQDGYAFDLEFSGNIVDDTTGFGVGAKKCTGLIISNNSFSCSVNAVVLSGTRFSNITINNNTFSESNPSSEGISVEVYRIKYLRIRNNVFDGLFNSVYIRSSATAGITLELQHVFILNNVFHNIRSTAVYLNGGGTGGIHLNASDIQVSGNDIVSALNGGNGIYLFVSGTGGALFDYENIRIHDNSISGVAELSTGISVSLMAEVDLHDLLIHNNYIDSCTNAGIYLSGAGGGNGYNVTTDITIRKNIIHGIANMGIVMTAPGACVSSVFRNAVIDSNSVSGCGQHAFRLYGTGNSNAVFDSIFIFRNSFFSNGANGIDLVHYGTTMSGIKMLENAVYNNAGAGIYLNQTPLVYGNPYIPPPVIDSVVVSGNVTSIYGNVSVPYSNRNFAVELFANSAPDPSGFGEGEYFLLRDTFLTDAAGIAFFSFTVPTSSLAGFYTATATDLIVGCTSVFSNVVGSVTSNINSVENAGISIFPVPVTDYLIVEGVSGGPADLFIYDSSAKLLGSHPITVSRQKIDFPYGTGIYFYQVIRNGKVELSGKAVKVVH